MIPEPCNSHTFLYARWSTFSGRFHTVSFTMQSHDQNSTSSLRLDFPLNWLHNYNKLNWQRCTQCVLHYHYARDTLGITYNVTVRFKIIVLSRGILHVQYMYIVQLPNEIHWNVFPINIYCTLNSVHVGPHLVHGPWSLIRKIPCMIARRYDNSFVYIVSLHSSLLHSSSASHCYYYHFFHSKIQFLVN